MATTSGAPAPATTNELYEPEVLLAYRADRPATGRPAIQAVYQGMVVAGMRFGME